MTMSNYYRIILAHMIVISTVVASDGSSMTWFEKLLTFLVSGALVFSLIKGYLTVNKIWKRRKNEEVAKEFLHLGRLGQWMVKGLGLGRPARPGRPSLG